MSYIVKQLKNEKKKLRKDINVMVLLAIKNKYEWLKK